MTLLDLRETARRHMPALPTLPHLHEAARATWRGRMTNEHASSTVFEALAAQLERAGFEETVVRQCRAFADEERRHGVLCGAVVEALGGKARAELAEQARFPSHDDVGPLEGALRNVLSVCCLSETVAVALIGAERLEMPDGPLRELLTSIYADEVGHARFGWQLLTNASDPAKPGPALDDEMRVRLARYLAIAFAHLEQHELAHLPLESMPPPEGVALGLCSGADARTLFYETIEHVIVPRLESVGIAARAAWSARAR